MKEIIEVPIFSDNVRRQKLPLSMATRANGFIFVSGIGPMDLETGEILRGTIEEQTAASLAVISTVLEASGASLAQVVNARIYVTNAGYYDSINAVWARHFPLDPPSRTFVTVGSWFNAFDIEIEVIAIDAA